MALRKSPPVLATKLDDASKVVKAATGLLTQTARLTRQLVAIVGWLVLLVATVRLLWNPSDALSPGQFVAHGAGAAAVLQGLVKIPARRRQSPPKAATTTEADEPSEVAA
ncbi:hypothetical protein ACQP2K_07550 [Microbispora siamensis]